MTNLEKVKRFHEVFGHPIATPEPGRVLTKLRLALIDEEILEFRDANDVVQVAKELADVLYVTYGYAVILGITIKETSNNILALRPRMVPDQLTFYKQLRDLYYDVEANPEANLERLLNKTWAIAEIYGLPIQEVFDEVNRSNMSKLDENGKPIYREDGKVLKGPNYSEADILSIIKKYV